MAKVIQSELLLSFICKAPSGKFICFSFSVSCPLQTVDRGTGETLRASVKRHTDLPVLDHLLDFFPVVINATTADRASANARCELSLALEDDRPRLRLACYAHVVSTVHGEVFCNNPWFDQRHHCQQY